MILIASREERDLIARLRAIGGEDKTVALTQQVIDLREEVAALKIERSRIEEDFKRQERELRHMVGLEQARQQAEQARHAADVEQAKQAAVLAVREENLKAEQQRFEDQLKFNTERFATMEKYLKDMFADVLNRLPNVNVKMKA